MRLIVDVIANIERPPGATRSRVLLVDQAPEVIGELVAVLRYLGFDVTVAADGRAAQAAAASTAPDVIVLEVWLPGTEYYEAYRALRAAGWMRRYSS